MTVSNAFGSETSTTGFLTVTPICVDIDLFAGLTLTGGVVDQSYRIQYITNLLDSDWITLTNITQKQEGVFFLDLEPANHQHRFYRVTP